MASKIIPLKKDKSIDKNTDKDINQDIGLDSYITDGKLKITVKPKSKKTEILGYDKEKRSVRISLKSPAIENKANIELIKFLKKLTGKDITIKSGLRSKEKLINII